MPLLAVCDFRHRFARFVTQALVYHHAFLNQQFDFFFDVRKSILRLDLLNRAV